jgi:hypothetical protein
MKEYVDLAGASRAASHLASGFRFIDRQPGVCQQSNLLEYRSLVPVDVFVCKLAIAEAHDS